MEGKGLRQSGRPRKPEKAGGRLLRLIAVQHKIAALQQPYGFESVRFFQEIAHAPQRMDLWPG
jgi:hypothetical protein